jgi:pimeloyl-ACP methyl ester carboxylesterase
MHATRFVCAATVFLGLSCSEGDDDARDPGTPPAPVEQSMLPLPTTLPTLEWSPCSGGFECATLAVPRDHADPDGPTLGLAVMRLRTPLSGRIGSLIMNFGGPGVATLDAFEDGAAGYFGGLNPRFDLVGFDPRGVGRTEGAIDCRVDPAVDEGVPLLTPDNLDRDDWVQRSQDYVDTCLANNPAGFAAHVSTADAARDMELVRIALGDEKLSYVGKSYGSLLGATYAALFPRNYRALVLDGGINPDELLNRPLDSYQLQTAAGERALDRLFAACASDQTACSGFGGADPRAAFEALVHAARETPIPVVSARPEPVDGDEILETAFSVLYDKRDWQRFAAALVAAQSGDGTGIRAIFDEDSYLLPDGTYDPEADRFFVISAVDSDYAPEIDPYQRSAELAWQRYPHFWWNAGYWELPLGLFPVEAAGVHRGPFRLPDDAASVLVLSTLHDPATPHEDALALVEQLGNARLLIMNGDGHTAYGGHSSCIDRAVFAYLERGELPAPGQECPDDVRFGQTAPTPDSGRAARAPSEAWRMPRALHRSRR